MNVIVLLKQVPETTNVKMDESTGTMIREGVESIVNPLDLYAIEEALQLREEHGGQVTAITMGPPACGKALREAVAMGCDRAIQASHAKFAGADTWATSYVLSETVKQQAGEFDLILCGERATDGDTGQVGPGVASFLHLPLVTYVSAVSAITAGGGNEARVSRLTEGGYEQLRVPFPALLTVVKEISFPRLPTLRGKQRAKKLEVPVVGIDDLELDENAVGLQGSPTRVVKIFRPKVSRNGDMHVVTDETGIAAATDAVLRFIGH